MASAKDQNLSLCVPNGWLKSSFPCFTEFIPFDVELGEELLVVWAVEEGFQADNVTILIYASGSTSG